MKRTIKWAVFLVLFAAVAFVWGRRIDVDLVAQEGDSTGQKEVELWNMYVDLEGKTRFRKLEMPYDKLIRIRGGVQFNRSERPPGTKPTDPNAMQGELHAAPWRRYMVTLSGSRRLIGSSGEVFTADPNHILLIEDTWGEGHAFLGGGSDKTVTLFVEVDEVTPRDRLLGVCQPPSCTP